MVGKKTSRKPAKAAAPMPKDAQCTCGAGCGCGCHRTKKILAKAIVIALIIFASVKIAECRIMHKIAMGGCPHAKEMKKGPEGRRGWWHRGEKPAEAKPEPKAGAAK